MVKARHRRVVKTGFQWPRLRLPRFRRAKKVPLEKRVYVGGGLLTPIPVRARFSRWIRGLRGPRWRFSGKAQFHAELSIVHITADGKAYDYGVVSRRLVTGAFVQRLTAQMAANFSGTDNWKYHAFGTDSTAEANTQTALGAEIETRDTGSQASGTSGQDGTYTTVATHTFSGTYTVAEHGVFNASSAGTLMDRSKFVGILVNASDQIQATYVLTAVAET